MEQIRLEYAYRDRFPGCGHTIRRFGWNNEEADVQFRAGIQPLVYFEGKCENCRARQNIVDSNISSLLNALRTEVDCYVTKLHEFSTENKELKKSISKKDVEIQKAREQSVNYRATWTKILAIKEKQDGELRTLSQEKKNYEAEIVQLRKTIIQQTLRKKINESKESPAENNLSVKNTSTPNLQALGPPQQNLTENALAAQSLNLQETARERSLSSLLLWVTSIPSPSVSIL
jgi:predicted  nucleic acid-binding Zn-ribbon protein